MSAIYERFGVRFQYPENWKILEEQVDRWPRSLTVQGPSGAFWSLTLHPLAEGAARCARQVVEIMRGEYGELEFEATEEKFGALKTTGYDVNFFCLDVLVAAHVRAWTSDRYVCVVMYQAEDREFDKLARVFQAITATLSEGR